MGLLYGRAGRLTALFGAFRPGQWSGGDRASLADPHGKTHRVDPKVRKLTQKFD
jgi:hypothetical protein